MGKTPEMQKFVDGLAEATFGATPPYCCVSCKQPFSGANVFTPAGWREVRISKMCEACFDKAFSEFDDEE